MKDYNEVAKSVFQRSEAIIADNRRKRKKLMGVGIPILCCVLVALVGFGANWREFVTDDPTTIYYEPPYTEDPTEDPNIVTEPYVEDPTDDPDIDNSQEGEGAHGSEGHFEYERAYDWKIYGISGDLIDYIRKTSDKDFDDWSNDRDEITRKIGISSPDFVPMILAAIEDFNIPKETFEKINSERISIYKSMGDNPFTYGCYTQEEIDAIYSNDYETITKVFATKYAIVANDRACAPQFYLQATTDELNKYGITEQQVKEKIDLLLEDKIIVIRDGEIMLWFGDDTVLPLY